MPCYSFGNEKGIGNSNSTINPYNPSVLLVGHRQIVQTQTSDQGLHCLLPYHSI